MPFTTVTVVAAEGTRIGLVTCTECGAAILLDPRAEDDYAKLHEAWHEKLFKRLNAIELRQLSNF